MPHVLRIIDANANRAREALRVMEDVARFNLNDASLSGALKSLRHDLRAAIDRIPGADRLLAHRDTPRDVGTRITTDAEHQRESTRDIALAASRRLTESLRSIEECCKSIGGPSREFEAMRYRAYDIEKQLIGALPASRADFRGWRLCVLITESLCTHHDWQTVAQRCLDAGADCLQLREKELDGAELLRRAQFLVELARPFHAAVIVNDRVDVAMRAGATGVHVGQTDLSVHDVRALAGDDLLVGVSTTTLEQAHQARADGADYCGVGAMFPTTTKRKDAIAGPSLLRDYLAADPPFPPALAIGGITLDNLPRLLDAAGRCFGVAVSAAVVSSRDPASVCRALLDALPPISGDLRGCIQG